MLELLLLEIDRLLTEEVKDVNCAGPEDETIKGLAEELREVLEDVSEEEDVEEEEEEGAAGGLA